MSNDGIVSTATMAFPKAKIVLQKVAEGDEELADAVRMSDQTIEPLEGKTRRSELRADAYTLSTIAASSNVLGLYTVERALRTALGFIQLVSRMTHKEHLVMPTIDGSDVAECASTLITELDQGIGPQERNIDLKALLGDIDEQNSRQMGDGKEEIAEYGDEVLVEEKREVEEKMDVQGPVSSEDEAEKDEEGEHDNDSIANPRDGDDGGTMESKGDPKEKTEDVVSSANPRDEGEGGTAEKKGDQEKETEATKKAPKRNHNKKRKCPLCPHTSTLLLAHLLKNHPVESPDTKTAKVWVAKADLLAKRQSKEKSNKRPTSWYQCGYKGCEKVVTQISQHLRRFHQLGDPDTIATAKKTFVHISGPSQKKKNTPSLSSVKSSVSIKKPSGSKRPPKKKTAAVPIKKAKLLDESKDEETETSTTTEESNYSLHDDSAEDDTPTEEDREDGDG